VDLLDRRREPDHGPPEGLEAAVIAVPHPSGWSVRSRGVGPEARRGGRSAEILTYLTDKLARWALPDEVVLIEAVPKTSVGKFDKKVLRERFKDWQPKS